jgi:hypothetical protein
MLNIVIDMVVPIYTGGIIVLILYYVHYMSYQTPPPVVYRVDNRTKKNCGNDMTDNDWIERFNATWLQHDSECFDEFLQFSGTSYVVRKVAPLLFHRCRHTYTFKGSKFCMLRDFGYGVKEWTLNLDFAQSEDSAAEICDVIDTGETYYFKTWLDHDKKRIFMKSTPANKDKGVINVHIRSLLDENNMKMVSL